MSISSPLSDFSQPSDSSHPASSPYHIRDVLKKAIDDWCIPLWDCLIPRDFSQETLDLLSLSSNDTHCLMLDLDSQGFGQCGCGARAIGEHGICADHL
jgi:hypothetical protein